jgi:pimeloyl-ACP methyl ester carboxylesterase
MACPPPQFQIEAMAPGDAKNAADAPLMVVPTRFGPIHFVGSLTGRTVLVLIAGAFEDERAFCRLPDLMPELDVLVAHLPGNHCPRLVDYRLETLTAAFDEAVGGLPASAVVVAGVSAGALIALGLKSATVKGLVLVDPPLRPYLAWPLKTYLDHGPPDRWDLVGPLFGVYSDRIEPRDHSHLLADLDRPAILLMGDPPPAEAEPLTGALPSLVDPITRAEAAAHPHVAPVLISGVGHDIPRKAGGVLLQAVRRLATPQRNEPRAP